MGTGNVMGWAVKGELYGQGEQAWSGPWQGGEGKWAGRGVECIGSEGAFSVRWAEEEGWVGVEWVWAGNVRALQEVRIDQVRSWRAGLCSGTT